VPSIILPEKPRKYPDPFIRTVHGTHGPCALCQHYSKLTENHVPPEAVGNHDAWLAQSYMTTMAADKDLLFGRRFSGGIRFRTLCEECNNALGNSEDRAIVDFYQRVQKLVDSPLKLPPVAMVSAKPNLIARGLYAHLASANDNGIPSIFDTEAREIFFRKRSLRLASWNLFYWVYQAPTMFLMRSAFLASFGSDVEMDHVHLLKAPPLAFAFSQRSTLYGLPNMMMFIQQNDRAETQIPLILDRRDPHPVWPAVPYDNQIVFLGGDSYGLVAEQH
jgi:hypothetical protein